MEEEQTDVNIRSIIRDAIQEFVKIEQTKTEPAYKAELIEERRRREQLEQKMNELAEENRRSRLMADEADRSSNIRAELQRLGVAKIDLAYKAVKDEVFRAEDGRLLAKATQGDVGLRDYLTNFVTENPELLPARMAGGSGAGSNLKATGGTASSLDLDKLKPGMNPEELERVRQEISRVAMQTLRGS